VKSHLRATERHLSYEITQCYLTPDTGKQASTPARQVGTQFNYRGGMKSNLVDVGGWAQDGLRVYRQSPTPAVTGTGIERSLIKTKALLITEQKRGRLI